MPTWHMQVIVFVCISPSLLLSLSLYLILSVSMWDMCDSVSHGSAYKCIYIATSGFPMIEEDMWYLSFRSPTTLSRPLPHHFRLCLPYPSPFCYRIHQWSVSLYLCLFLVWEETCYPGFLLENSLFLHFPTSISDFIPDWDYQTFLYSSN